MRDGAADRFNLSLFGGDDHVSLRGTHRLAALGRDHPRLHAPLGYCPGEALADALGKVQASAPLFGHEPNLSKKRAK